jgi:hypothetical protein
MRERRKISTKTVSVRAKGVPLLVRHILNRLPAFPALRHYIHIAMADLDASIQHIDNASSRYLPLPDRPSVLLVLGIWCWAGDDIYVLAKKQNASSDSNICDRSYHTLTTR